MSRPSSGVLRLLVLAIVLATAEPAWAHLESAIGASSAGPIVAPEPLTASLPGLATQPEAQAMVWPLLVGTLIAAGAAWRRRRVFVATGLAALLSVFAFEDAVHSVHHGLGPVEAKDCAVAVASAHVAGTAVGPLTAVDLIPPPAEERGLEPNVARLAVRCPCPAQGRAPPA